MTTRCAHAEEQTAPASGRDSLCPGRCGYAIVRPDAHPRSPAPSHDLTPLPCAARSVSVQQLGAQDVEAFIKNLVENGDPTKKVAGLGKGSLTAMGGAKAMKGAPEGVEANNFDGMRSFGGTDMSMFQ